MRFTRLHPSNPTETPFFHSLTLFAFLVLLITPHSTHALWPQPRSLQNGTSALRLAPSESFTITVAVPNAPADLLAAAQRTRARLFTDKLARLEPTHGAADVRALSNANSNVLPGLTLRLEGDGAPEWGVRRVAEEACAPLEGRQAREGYSLEVPADGSGAVLSAASTLGLFRGLNTFAQLWYYYRCADGIGGGDYARGEGEDAPLGAGAGACGDGDGSSSSEMVYTLMAPVMIEDSPAYVRRGRDYCLRPV